MVWDFFFETDMNYKAIIFDCYGTLFLFGDMKKAWKDWFNSFYNFLVESGHKIDYDYFNSQIDGFFSIPAPSRCEDCFTLFEQRLFDKLTTMDIFFESAKISKLAQTTIDAWHDEVKIDSETVNVLTKLNNTTRLALLSNFDHPPHIYRLLKKYNIAELFEEIIISGEVGTEKPDPLIFSLALSRLNLSNHEVLYIGDSEEDYLGARNSEIDFLLINRNDESTTKLSNDYKEDTTELENDWSGKYDDIKRIKSLTELLNL